MRRKNRLPIFVLAGGLGLILLGVGAALFFIVDGDEGEAEDDAAIVEEKPSESTEGTVGGPEQISSPPASRFNLLVEEFPENYEVDVPNTFALNITQFEASYWFPTGDEGRRLAIEWNTLDAFQALFQPTGLDADVLRGEAFVTAETYMFADVASAKKAWAYYDNVLKNSDGSDPVVAKRLANDSSAHRFIQGTVGTSDVVQVFHRFSFRRGNTIVSVQTRGGLPFYNIDTARRFAVIIDNKLLGTRDAVEPTPIPTPGFGIGN